MDAIALAAYAKQLLPRSKAAVCCILSCSIVWMRLYLVGFTILLLCRLHCTITLLALHYIGYFLQLRTSLKLFSNTVIHPYAMVLNFSGGAYFCALNILWPLSRYSCSLFLIFSYLPYYTLLFHSLFKVEFYIDHFVLGEHWEC